jgi:hypothetical protein
MSALDDVLKMNERIPQGCATQLREAVSELAALRARHDATVTQNEAYRQLVADLNDDISRLQRVARIAAQILFVVSHTQRPMAICEHGNAACYPTHGWWCDDCFGELQSSLDLANVEYIPKTEGAE